MRTQPLEVYEVEETGELVLKHQTDLREVLVSHCSIMIVNHNDKAVVLWIGKGASTRAKFAAARSSRRFLTERSISYRVRTCDEGDEPEWFQNLFNMKIAARSRDDPPSLEVLAILNEMKAKSVPDGFEREACIISRDFYVPVELKSSIMGKDTSTIKFEKSSYMPEGFFILPSGAYRPRLLVRNGKVLGIDLLVNYDISAREGINLDLLQEAKGINLKIENLQQDIEKKDKKIWELKKELSEKNEDLVRIRLEIKAAQEVKGTKEEKEKILKDKDKLIYSLQHEIETKKKQFEKLRQSTYKKDVLFGELEEEISELKPKLERLQQSVKENKEKSEKSQFEGAKKDQSIEELQQDITQKTDLIDTLQKSIPDKDSEIEKLGREGAQKDQQLEDLRQEISKKDKELRKKAAMIDDMEKELREKSRRVQELEAK